MSFRLTTLFGLTACLFFTGCNDATDADKIAEAQYCLDKSSSTTAQACAAKLEGIESAQAYIIRCSADFIEQGFDDPQRLVSAMNYVTGGNTNTPGLLSVLAFTKKPSNSTNSTNATNADQTFTFCQKSQQKGLMLIASLAKSATQIAGLASGASGINFNDSSTFTATNIQNALNQLVVSGTANTPVGETVQTVYNVTCGGSTQTNSDVCTQLNSAASTYGVNFSTSTPAQIGDALTKYWQTGH